MQNSCAVNPLKLEILDASGYTTGQLYTDDAHLNEIAADMATRGWRGAPLVVLADYALSYTGTHRLAAAEKADLDHVPAVDLEELFAACGLDLWEVCDAHDLSVTTDRPEILAHLPSDVLAAYTLDDIC